MGFSPELFYGTERVMNNTNEYVSSCQKTFGIQGVNISIFQGYLLCTALLAFLHEFEQVLRLSLSDLYPRWNAELFSPNPPISF